MRIDWFIVDFIITASLCFLSSIGVKKTKSVTFCYIVSIIAVVVLLAIEKA